LAATPPSAWLPKSATEPACGQEYASGLEQRLDDEAEPIVAQGKASVIEHPGIAALDRPAARSQP
jgi:hypothetical protein